jgi:hypothetical protein
MEVRAFEATFSLHFMGRIKEILAGEFVNSRDKTYKSRMNDWILNAVWSAS